MKIIPLASDEPGVDNTITGLIEVFQQSTVTSNPVKLSPFIVQADNPDIPPTTRERIWIVPSSRKTNLQWCFDVIGHTPTEALRKSFREALRDYVDDHKEEYSSIFVFVDTDAEFHSLSQLGIGISDYVTVPTLLDYEEQFRFSFLLERLFHLSEKFDTRGPRLHCLILNQVSLDLFHGNAATNADTVYKILTDNQSKMLLQTVQRSKGPLRKWMFHFMSLMYKDGENYVHADRCKLIFAWGRCGWYMREKAIPLYGWMNFLNLGERGYLSIELGEGDEHPLKGIKLRPNFKTKRPCGTGS